MYFLLLKTERRYSLDEKEQARSGLTARSKMIEL
jgi:hypothetical protein